MNRAVKSPRHVCRPRGRSRGRALELQSLEQRLALAATLVRDINPGAAWSNTTELTTVGATLYFAATNGANGAELWKTDGTLAGTTLVKDIATGTASSSPHQLTNVGGTLYFVANDGTTGSELWKSDGTTAGTTRVKDIAAMGVSSSPSGLVDVGGTLYFSASDGVAGFELWKSNGTAAGTAQVRDIRPGGGSSAPAHLTNVNGVLYFSATDGARGTELWKSDGTSAGTVLVSDLIGGSASSNPANFVASGARLYFTAATVANGVELWKSDAAGTAMVRDIAGGIASSNPSNLTVVGSRLYFSAVDAGGSELWSTDGTTAGTVLVKDIQIGPNGSIAPANAYYNNLAAVGSTLYFAANDGTIGLELWKSNGTTAGTLPIKDISPGAASSSPLYLTAAGGALYFTASDPSAGYELWRSDGTAAGTTRVADIKSGSAGSLPGNVTALGGSVMLVADNGVSGRELWRTASLVADQHVFYNRSGFDGDDAMANARDDAAIDPDKHALLPGRTATFANYTGYSRGINGLMIDVQDLVLDPAQGDFTFRVGNDNNPAAWAAAPAPSSISVRRGAGAGGSDRITLIWPDGAIQKQWLQVTLKTTIGLIQPSVFYFGNAVGEAGNSATNAQVDANDEIVTRNNPRTFRQPATVTSQYDFDHDGFVNAADQIFARSNASTPGDAVQLIAVPAALAELPAIEKSVPPLAQIAVGLGSPAVGMVRKMGLRSYSAGSGPNDSEQLPRPDLATMKERVSAAPPWRSPAARARAAETAERSRALAMAVDRVLARDGLLGEELWGI